MPLWNENLFTGRKKKKEIQCWQREVWEKGGREGSGWRQAVSYKVQLLFPFAAFLYPVLWACGLITMTCTCLLLYYMGFITHNSLLRILPVWEAAGLKKPNKSQNFQNLTFPALLAASTSCKSQWKLTFPPTPWISSKLRFDPDVLISTQLKCNQMLDFGG